MANPAADFTVEVVADSDTKVTLVGSQLVTATPADVGKVVIVGPDGTLVLGSAGIPQAFDAVALHANGHSWVDGVGTADQNLDAHTWLAHIERGLHTTGTANVSVGASRMADFVGQVLGTDSTWVPGTRLLVVVDGTLNDVTTDAPSAKKTAGLVHSLRALLHVYSHGAKVESSAASWDSGGAWATVAHASASGGSFRRTVTQNAYYEREVEAGDVVLIHGHDGPGATVRVAMDGVEVNSLSTANQMLTSAFTGLAFCPIAVEAESAGLMRLTKTDAGAGPLDVDVLLKPMATPPNIVVVLDGAIPHASFAAGGGQAELDAMNAATTEVVAEFATAATAAPVGWDAEDHTGDDDVHPNDAGYALLASAILSALAGLEASNGTIVLGELVLPEGEASPGNTTPNAAAYAGAPAGGAVLAGGLVASPWAGFGQAIAAPQINFGPDGTADLDGSFCVEIRVRTAAGSAGVNESIVNRDGGNVPGAELFRIYTVMEFGIGFVAQWRTEAGVEAQILGPAIAANTNYEVAMSWDQAAGLMRLFVNGNMVGTSPVATTVENPDLVTPLTVGVATSGIPATISTVDELRISNVARRTGNYVPDAGPFVDDGPTVVLAHFDVIDA